MSPIGLFLQTENATDITSGHMVLMFTYSQVVTLSKEGIKCGSAVEHLSTDHNMPGSNSGDAFSFRKYFTCANNFFENKFLVAYNFLLKMVGIEANKDQNVHNFELFQVKCLLA